MRIKVMMMAALLAPVLALGGGARAQSPLGAIDADGDGAVSEAEFLANADTRFARLDADGSGALTGEELRALPNAPATGPAGVSKEMFRNAMRQRFKRLDADGDGKATVAEIQAARPQAAPAN